MNNEESSIYECIRLTARAYTHTHTHKGKYNEISCMTYTSKNMIATPIHTKHDW
jgi:hypothetical protein